MRILLLVTDAYGGRGGIALFNRHLAAALARRHSVTVVPRVVAGAPEPLPTDVRFRAEAAAGSLAYARVVVDVLRQRPDVVICGHLNLLPVACAIAAQPVLLLYGIEAWKPRRWRPTSWMSRRCRALVSISALTRDRFLSWSGYRGPSYILPNPVDLGLFGVRPKRRDLVERLGLDGRRVLLTVGRLAAGERYKGVDEVLDVLPSLPPEVVYLVAGGGDDAPRLAHRAAILGLADRVRFTGAFADADKVDLYNLADVFVMPSRGEGFGFVFLEAMACGLPVIGGKHDGGREALLDGRLGLLVDPANPAEIRAAILELLERGERRVPDELERFSIERFALRVDGLMAAVS